MKKSIEEILHKNKYKILIEEYLKLPNPIENLAQVANAFLKHNDYYTAIQIFTKLLELKPNDLSFYTNLAELHLIQKEYEIALDFYKKASLVKGNIPINETRRILESKVGISSLEKIIALIPEKEEEWKNTLELIGNNYGKYFKILHIIILKRLVRLDRKNPDYYLTLAAKYYDSNEFKKTKYYLFKSYLLNSNNTKCLDLLGYVYSKEDNFTKAVQYLEHSIEINKDSRTDSRRYEYLMNAYINLKEFDTLSLFLKDNIDCAHSLIHILNKNKNISREDLRTCLYAIGDEPSSLFYLYRNENYNIYMRAIAFNLLEERRSNLSSFSDLNEPFLEELVSQFPENISHRYELSKLYMKENKKEKAIQCLEYLLRQEKQFYPTVELINLYIENKKEKDARDLANSLFGFQQTLDDLRYKVYPIYDKLNLTNKKLECLEILKGKDSGNDWTLNFIAREYAALDEFTKAIECHHISLQIEPKQNWIYKELGWLYNKTNQNEKAIQSWKEYFINISYIGNESIEDTLKIIEILFNESNKLPEGEQLLSVIKSKSTDALIFKKFLEREPDNIDLIKAYLKYGRESYHANTIPIQEAIHYYTHLIQVEPNIYEYYEELGRCYSKLQKTEAEIENFKKAIEFGSPHSYFWMEKIDKDLDKDKSSPYIELLLLLEEKRLSDIEKEKYNLGVIGKWYYINKNYKKASYYLEKVFQSVTDHLSYYEKQFLQTINSYLFLSQIDKAIELIEIILLHKETENKISSVYSTIYFPFTIIFSEDINQKTLEEFFKKIPKEKRWISFFDRLSHTHETKDNIRLLVLKKQFEIDSDDKNLIYEIGKIYESNKEYEKAIQHYKKFIHHQSALESLAYLSLELENTEDAKTYFLELLERNDSRDYYNHYLNDFWNFCEKIKNPQLYIDYLLKQVQREDKNSERFSFFYKRIADAYQRTKNYSKAISYYQKSYDHKPQCILFALIGDSYFCDKKYSEALEYFIKALETDYNDETQRDSPYFYVFQILLTEKDTFDKLSKSFFFGFNILNRFYSLLLDRLSQIHLRYHNVILKSFSNSPQFTLEDSWKIGIYNQIKENYYTRISTLNLYDWGKALFNNNQHKEAQEKLEQAKDQLSKDSAVEDSLLIVSEMEVTKEHLLWDINSMLNSIKNAQERDFQNKQGYLSFLSHTLRNSLSGGTSTIERIMHIGKKAIEADFSKYPESYNAFSDLNILYSTFNYIESLLDTFKLFTKDESKFIEEWNQKENGEVSPQLLIGYAIKQLLHRILFAHPFIRIRKKLINTVSIEDLQQNFLLNIAQKEFNDNSIEELFIWINNNIPLLQIKVIDSETKWNNYGVKFNLLFSIISEILLNALKYSDGEKPIVIEWIKANNSITIKSINTYNIESTKYKDTQSGLKFIQELLERLKNVEFISIPKNKNEFKIELKIREVNQ